MTTEAEKRKALSAQLQFRKVVFKQKAADGDATAYNLTVVVDGRRKPVPIEQLKAKVLTLINAASQGAMHLQVQVLVLVKECTYRSELKQFSSYIKTF